VAIEKTRKQNNIGGNTRVKYGKLRTFSKVFRAALWILCKTDLARNTLAVNVYYFDCGMRAIITSAPPKMRT